MRYGASIRAALLGFGLVGATAAPAFAQAPPLREACFGQTHSHTSWSLDAYIVGNHVTGPAEAYQFSMGQAIKLHRNVFFRDSKKVPVAPFSAIDSSYPNDLWTWMDGQRKTGIELLAISHSANLSDAARVREEILYREALAMGLDKDDTIVKRRLAQKMEFLAEDVSGLREPAPDELRSWYAKHGERFALPGRRSFRHLFFSQDRRGERAREGAAQAIKRLDGVPVDASGGRGLADPFMSQDYYADRTPHQVAAVFGAKFAEALFQPEPGAWQGPIESGLGWFSAAPGRVPTFEEVDAAVPTAWMDEQRADAQERAFEAMAARYQIILPRPRGASR